MLRLVINPEPRWIDLLAGVRVKVRPCTSAIFAAATSGKDISGLGADITHEHHWSLITSAIAGLAIIEWEGVGDEEGAPMPVTPEAIGALMDMVLINQAFSAEYVRPYLMMVQEKKELPPSPNGPSGAGRNTVEAVGRNAKNARKSSTRR